MSSEDRIDEQAIRDQLEASLDSMQQGSVPPAEDAMGVPETDDDDDGSEGDDAPSGSKGEGGKSGRKGGGGGGGGLPEGVITAIQGDDVYVELGPRVQGVIPVTEFDEPPQVGEKHRFSLVSIQDNLWTLSRKEARALATWKDLQKGRSVKATVIGHNSGGLEMKVGPVSAFMPASEIDTKRIDDFTPLVNETMVCEVLEVSRRRKRVVLSRKAVLQRERREARERSLDSLAPGQTVRGKVERIEPFGAFVDIGNGVTGLLHISNWSHQRVEDPNEVMKVGDALELQILDIKNGGKRIGLGRKQLLADPWDEVRSKYRAGSIAKGKVVRIAEFGAFVELLSGVEGLLHKSQLSDERIHRVEDAVKVGDEVTVRVQSVDFDKRRVSLSRLTERGHLIGSDEDIDSADLGKYLDDTSKPASGTNLGALLRAALEKKGGPGS